MPLALSEEQHQLADAVREFAARHAPIDKIRSEFGTIAAGQLPPWWQEFVDTGFHAVHLPERFGGQGGSLADMACVVEAAAAALLPGPWLCTATAGAVALSGDIADDDAVGVSLLRDLATGATACVVLPDYSDFHARPHNTGWRLTGSSGVTLGVCSAQHVVVPARTDDGSEVWFVLDTTLGPLTARPLDGTDLCTDVGVLEVRDHLVAEDKVLGGIDSDRARCIVVTLAACAAAGTLRWSLNAATEYLRTREQFGKPIGTFQAMQHKAATLLVNTELAEAAAWDAVRAADDFVLE